MVHLAALDRVAQRAHDRLLADDLGERARAMPAVQRPLLLVAFNSGDTVGLSLPTATGAPPGSGASGYRARS